MPIPAAEETAFSGSLVSFVAVCVCGEHCDSCGGHVPQGVPQGLQEGAAHPRPLHRVLLPWPHHADWGESCLPQGRAISVCNHIKHKNLCHRWTSLSGMWQHNTWEIVLSSCVTSEKWPCFIRELKKCFHWKYTAQPRKFHLLCTSQHTHWSWFLLAYPGQEQPHFGWKEQ